MILCAIAAMILGVLGLFDFSPFPSADYGKVILLLIGGITIALASIQISVRQIKKSQHSTASWQRRFPDTLAEDMKRAQKIDIYGLELSSTLSEFKVLLERKAKKGAEIRFIIAAPDGNVIEMIKMKYKTEVKTAARIIDSLEIMRRIKSMAPARTRAKVVIKVLDYLLPRKAIILSPRIGEPSIYLQTYTFRWSTLKPKEWFCRGDAPEQFDFYQTEFQELFEAAEEDQP